MTWADRYDNDELLPGEPIDEGEQEEREDAENDAAASETGEAGPQ